MTCLAFPGGDAAADAAPPMSDYLLGTLLLAYDEVQRQVAVQVGVCAGCCIRQAEVAVSNSRIEWQQNRMAAE